MSRNTQYNKEDVINSLVTMRIEKCASTKTLIGFLTGPCGFSTTMAYEYLKWMRERIAETYQEQSNSAVKEEAILQYEEMIERMRKEKNWKMWSELNRELNKIKQIAIDRIDHTTKGKEITGLTIEIINPNETTNKGNTGS